MNDDELYEQWAAMPKGERPLFEDFMADNGVNTADYFSEEEQEQLGWK